MKSMKARSGLHNEVTGVYNNDTMLRQIAESIRIRKDGDINNKREWNTYLLPRAVIES